MIQTVFIRSIGGVSRLKTFCSAAFTAPCGPISAVNATATTIVGSTNGIVVTATTIDLPRNSCRPIAHAHGMASASVSTVDSAACQRVNHARSR